MPYLRNLENVQSNGGGEFHICAKCFDFVRDCFGLRIRTCRQVGKILSLTFRSISSAYDEVQIFYGKVNIADILLSANVNACHRGGFVV